MLILQDISYTHPDKDTVFSGVSLSVNAREKIALTGNNGSGKSTLLKMIAGALQPSGGQLTLAAKPYYVPQHFGQYNHLTLAQALGIQDKLKALQNILSGDTREEQFSRLDDDWTIAERCAEALAYWDLAELDLFQNMSGLSGGEKTKVFLAGVFIHQPELILLDEPSNHLDASGRKLLYDFVQSSRATMVIVSHDRRLLNLLERVCELSKDGIKVYGGNYAFYAAQKQAEKLSLNQEIQSREKALRKAKEKERETLERQQKLNSRGKGKQEKAGVARIMMNTLRNHAENSTAKLKGIHAEKTGSMAQELQELHDALPGIDTMKLGFDDSRLHKGKMLFEAKSVNYSYGRGALWEKDLDLEITSGMRMAMKGPNGSGKTSLIKLILGRLEPQTGTVYRAAGKVEYIDQDYSLLDDTLNVYQQAQGFNTASLPEHEIKTRLSRFLFAATDWDKACGVLSGGERMRLMLCCLTIGDQQPDMIILDEPTNNLDIQNTGILTAAVNAYRGTLVVVSHDESFLDELGIEKTIRLARR